MYMRRNIVHIEKRSGDQVILEGLLFSWIKDQVFKVYLKDDVRL